MKVFLVGFVLIVGAALYCLNDFSQVSTPILNHIAQQEGSADSVQQAAQDAQQGQPGQVDAFVAKYKPFLDQRYDLARVDNVLDDDAMMALCEDTFKRYNNTPLQNDPGFGFVLLHRGILFNDRQNFQSSADMFVEYLALFPNGDGAAVAKNAIFSLRINHGIQIPN